jgi:hypothetical protein
MTLFGWMSCVVNAPRTLPVMRRHSGNRIDDDNRQRRRWRCGGAWAIVPTIINFKSSWWYVCATHHGKIPPSCGWSIVPVVGNWQTRVAKAILMVVFIQEGLIDLINPRGSPGLFGWVTMTTLSVYSELFKYSNPLWPIIRKSKNCGHIEFDERKIGQILVVYHRHIGQTPGHILILVISLVKQCFMR